MNVATYVVALVLALTGCAKDKSHGLATVALRDAIAKNEVIELKKFTPFPWERVHFFAPYTPPAVIKTEVGTEIPFPHSSNEGYCLIVFLSGGAIVASFEVRRGDADFSELHRRSGYGPEEAIFTVKQTPDGWKRLQKG